MTKTKCGCGRLSRSPGFTLIELIICVAILSILFAVASPPFLQWRGSKDANRGARSAYDALREARSKAMTTNYQHVVKFDQPNRRFLMQKGTRAYNTPANGWSAVQGQDWTTLGSGVTMKSGADCSSTDSVNVLFNANGTASFEAPAGTPVVPPAGVTVCVQGGSTAKVHMVVLSASGRISLQ